MTLPPELRVELAFEAGAWPGGWVLGAGALGSTTVLAGADVDVWTDVTADVRAVRVQRGRARELEEYQPARCTIELRNSHRAYDPTNLAGPHVAGGVTQVKPGRHLRVFARHPATLVEYPLFFGTVRDWGIGYPDQLGYVKVSASDALADLAATDVALTIPAGTPGAAVDAVMAAAGVTRYTADVGVSTLQAHAFTGNALAALQLIARSEFGAVYSDAAGFVRFRERGAHYADARSSDIQYAFAGGAAPFRDLALDYSSENMRNIVTLTRVGGLPQTATNPDAVNEYGPRSWARDGLIVASDAGLLLVAGSILEAYALPVVRVRGFEYTPNVSDAQLTHALDAELRDRIEVTFAPPLGGTPIVAELLIASIEHQLRRGATPVTRYQLEAAFDSDVWRLGASQLGVDTKLAAI